MYSKYYIGVWGTTSAKYSMFFLASLTTWQVVLKEVREEAKQLFGEQVPKLEKAQLQMSWVGNLPSKSEEVQEASPLVPRKRLEERAMT